ncbi:MAG TPA: hypothetical protein VE994_05000 [Terriglobales bacterium]|nr:hypothetical protein [Terriglobales bacterium]
MRKQFLFVTAMFLVLAVASYGQSTSSSSQSSNPDNSVQSGSSASSNASSSSQGSSVQTSVTDLKGCIIRQETDYFIQPVNGSRVRLNGGSQDLSEYVGKNVDVHGRWNPYNNNNENNHQATTQPSGAPITGPVATGEKKGENGQVFLVTQVDKISDTCPMGTPGNTSNPQ